MPAKISELDNARPTSEQLKLIRRFIVAFNAIETHLTNRLGAVGHKSFGTLVSDYERRYPAWRLGSLFREFAVVRNGLIHNETESERYLYVPLAQVVKEIERQRQLFLRSEPVLPRSGRDVLVIAPHTSVTDALSVMLKGDFSQLPVYDGAQFRGLLTENGITRWLGRLVAEHGYSLDLERVVVSEALRQDEKRREVAFVSEDQEWVEVASQFISNPLLEAILVTHSGSSTERLLGIVTAWDIARQR